MTYYTVINELPLLSQYGYVFVEWQLNGKAFDFATPVNKYLSNSSIPNISNHPVYVKTLSDGTHHACMLFKFSSNTKLFLTKKYGYL